MDDIRQRTEEFLSEKPEGETALRELLRVDEQNETWEFDDIDIGSGLFGELVSRDFVEKESGAYKLADADSIRAVLDDDEPTETQTEESGQSLRTAVEEYVPAVTASSTELLALLAVVSLAVVLRALPLSSVYRQGAIVLSGNDPYFYLSTVEQIFESGTHSLLNLPTSIEQHDVLLFALLVALVTLVPSGVGTPAVVTAWYPVVIAAISIAVVYLIGYRLTDDRRVGLASAVLLAVTPVHAFRTSLGFADHHAFDYLWLAVTLLGLVVLARERQTRDVPTTASETLDRVPLGPTVLLAVGVAGQSLAWRGSPLLLAPLGIYALVQAVRDHHTERHSVFANAPFVSSLVGAASLVLAFHLLLGWAQQYQVLSLWLLSAGAFGVFFVSTVSQEYGISTKATVGSTVAVTAVTAAVAWVVFPVVPQTFARFTDWFGSALGNTTGGTTSLFDAGFGIFVGPVLFYGFILYVALPYAGSMSLKLHSREYERWVPVVVYFWYLLLPAGIFVRFGGSFAVPTALLGGYGFVHLSSRLDIVRRPDPIPDISTVKAAVTIPDRRTVLNLLVVFLLIAGIAVVQIPIKQSQLQVESETYETARWIADDVDGADLEYPENYVFSQWGRNRVYNYFVNGVADDTHFAKANYASFVQSTSPETWYEQLREEAGYIVTRPAAISEDESAIGTRLHQHFGSTSETTDGLGHYRAVYATANGERKVFVPTAGATLTGRATPGSVVTVRHNVSVEHESFVYERQSRATQAGFYAVRVPYAGQYEVDGNRTTVPETDVETGQFVGERNSVGTWLFDSASGDIAFDADGNNHGRIEGPTWASRTNGSALSFGGSEQRDAVVVDRADQLDASDELTVSLWFKTNPEANFTGQYRNARLLTKANRTDYGDTNGYVLATSRGKLFGALGNESETALVGGPRIDDSSWHHAVMTWDGQRMTLYLNGERVGTDQYSGRVTSEQPFVVGNTVSLRQSFAGQIDSVRYRPVAWEESTVRERYNRNSP